MPAEWVNPFECLECGAPADIVGGHTMDANDSEGDCELWADMILCVTGKHRYHLIDETRTIRK